MARSKKPKDPSREGMHHAAGIARTEDVKARISATMAGRKQTEEHVTKRSGALKGKPSSKANNEAVSKARSVAVIIDGVTYASAAKASEALGVGRTTIVMRLKNDAFANYQYVSTHV